MVRPLSGAFHAGTARARRTGAGSSVQSTGGRSASERELGEGSHLHCWRVSTADRPVATTADIHAAIDAVWRIESARLIAGLARIVRDVGLAEELAQDALVAALEQWPAVGRPGQSGRLADGHREAPRRSTSSAGASMLERKHEELGRELRGEPAAGAPDLDAALDDDVGDDLLRLMFIACHPVLSTEARVALTLRLLGGLTTDEIARAFLVPEPTIAQRIVRAKRTLARSAGAVRGAARRRAAPRGSPSVLEVIYLVFNEGYCRDRRRRLDAARAVRGRAAARPHPRRARAGASRRCTGSSR